ncbi:hypothetical protein [Desulfopila inferna]|uniref:hypothetical protein n=1 Tax=Desulfopila inferna TaxID=468528 RepID=UPI0019627B87|nr:hypothetical protein [Desulfopila inferna]MBM9603415.1 hypothetical protein [Desulfopila inferna]
MVEKPTTYGISEKMAAKRQRSRVTVDLKKNRLIVMLVGTIRKADLESIYTDIRFCVGDLQREFDVITDMRNSRIGYLTGIATFLKIQNFLQEKEVGRIVRITGQSKTFLQQIQRLTPTKSGYNPVYMQSMEEAEEFLSKI